MTMNKEPISCEEHIHDWFGLTYANYLTIPRSVLQSMPVSWQRKFVDLLMEMQHEFGYLEWPNYHVQCYRREPEWISIYEPCDECDRTGEIDGELCDYCDSLGEIDTGEDRYETIEEIGVRTDPIPHYNRGRTRLTRASEMIDSQ